MAKKNDSGSPLFVDLDGTLTLSDVSFESLLALIRKNPFYIFLVLAWLLKGRSYCKRQIAKRVKLDVSTLPLETDLLNFLKSEKKRGRKLILASASDELLVKPVAEEIDIFDDVIAGEGKENISGKNKLKKIQEYCKGKGFAYAGNSNVDFHVWDEADEQIVVTNSKSFAARAKKRYPDATFYQVAGELKPLLKSLRPHQWVKNLLIFAPIIMAHRIAEIDLLLASVYSFIAFCLCASAVYVVNDLFDLESDRKHARKSKRPLASGLLSIRFALLVPPLFFISSITIALFLRPAFFLYLLIYIIATCAYSFRLKQIAVIDIILLSLLYTLRIMAGGAATQIPVSYWLKSFALFIFLSLACIKRYSELLLQGENNGGKLHGRGYQSGDRQAIASFGAASGYIAILVLVFYISSKDVTSLYDNHEILWLLCPLFLYWITRIWLLAWRGEVHDDPIVFALRDVASYVVAFAVGMLLLLAV